MKIIENIKDIKELGFDDFLLRNSFGKADYKSQYMSAVNLAGGTIGKGTIINLGKLVLNGVRGRVEVHDGTRCLGYFGMSE